MRLGFVAMILCLLLVMPIAAQQSGEQKDTIGRVELRIATSAKSTITFQEAKELRKQLQQQEDRPLEVSSLNHPPVAILEAKIRGVKREQQTEPSGKAVMPINDYAMRLALSLKNETEKKISGVGVEFKNTEAGHTFYIYWNPFALTHHQSREIGIDLMTVSGDPGHLAVSIAGVQFDDESVWGRYPFPPLLKMPMPLPPNSDVDTKPRPLNSPQPRYTEEARKHKVLGAAGLQLEVGADGSVMDVRVSNALPDGLTEEAIRAARQIKFSPAMKKGQPVACWIKTMVEFYLK
ncbi:MAG: energy transducer TonB [Blastocatellia bacterium]